MKRSSSSRFAYSLLGEPARVPGPDDPQPQTDRIGLLSQRALLGPLGLGLRGHRLRAPGVRHLVSRRHHDRDVARPLQNRGGRAPAPAAGSASWSGRPDDGRLHVRGPRRSIFVLVPSVGVRHRRLQDLADRLARIRFGREAQRSSCACSTCSPRISRAPGPPCAARSARTGDGSGFHCSSLAPVPAAPARSLRYLRTDVSCPTCACPRKIRVGANSPSLWPTMFSVT